MTIKSWIEDLDVDGVHLVGDPANRRPFAVVKNLAGGSPRPKEQPVDKTELLAAIEKHKADPEVLQALQQAGLQKAQHQFASLEDCLAAGRTQSECEAMMKALQKQRGDEEATLGEKVLAAVRKLFGGEPDTTTAARQAMLKALGPEARAYVEALEGSVGTLTKKVEELVRAREDEGKAAIRKRAEALKGRGVDLDVEKATEPEVRAHEAAQAQIDKALEGLGVTRVYGSAKDGKGERTAREEVEKEVQRRLGDRAVDGAELSRIRRAIYQEHPGLLSAVRKEERAERAQA